MNAYNNVRKYGLLLACLVMWSNAVLSENGGYEKLDNIKLSGRVFNVCLVAYADFEKKIARYLIDDTSDFAIHMSNIDNYDITVSQNKNIYIVIFTPRSFQNQQIKGGGARYEVDIENRSIRNKNYYK